MKLSRYTSFGLGGRARAIVHPRNKEELKAVLDRGEYRILGNGSNILVPDHGYDGTIILLDKFNSIKFEGNTVRAGAGVQLQRLVSRTLWSGLEGLEAFAGIPATVGGAVRTNAGGKYGRILEYVVDVQKLSGVITSVVFGLQMGNSMARFRAILNEKKETQPLRARSAGCIFANPLYGAPAGELIERSGLKGRRNGGAVVSEKHANFIVAEYGCTSEDVSRLIAIVRKTVFLETGVELQIKIELW